MATALRVPFALKLGKTWLDSSDEAKRESEERWRALKEEWRRERGLGYGTSLWVRKGCLDSRWSRCS